jgi:hypothetical protein
MEQTNKQEQVFLEVMRIRPRAPRKTGENKLRFTAWCQRCGTKVNLVAQNQTQFSNTTGALHLRLVFGGELLVCFNSLMRDRQRQSINL